MKETNTPPAEASMWVNKARTEATKPTKTWFVKQTNGRVFACGEQECWQMLQNANNAWTLRGNTIIGTSDGRIYAQGVKEAYKLEGEEKVARVRKAYDDEMAQAIKNGPTKPRDMGRMDMAGNPTTVGF